MCFIIHFNTKSPQNMVNNGNLLYIPPSRYIPFQTLNSTWNRQKHKLKCCVYDMILHIMRRYKQTSAPKNIIQLPNRSNMGVTCTRNNNFYSYSYKWMMKQWCRPSKMYVTNQISRVYVYENGITHQNRQRTVYVVISGRWFCTHPD